MAQLQRSVKLYSQAGGTEFLVTAQPDGSVKMSVHDGSPEQLWTKEEICPGQYFLKNGNGKYMRHGHANGCGPVTVAEKPPCANPESFLWCIEKLDCNFEKISVPKNFCPQAVLDAKSGFVESGTELITFGWKNGDNQKWGGKN